MARRALGWATGMAAAAACTYYWPELVDPGPAAKNFQLAAAAPKLRATSWALIQSSFKDAPALKEETVFGDPTDLQRSTATEYLLLSREHFQIDATSVTKNTFKLRNIEDVFSFDFAVRNKKNEEIGSVHAEFKLSGENFRSSKASYRHFGSPKRSTSTTFEVKDPLEPVASDLHVAAYFTKSTQTLSSFFNSGGL